MQDILDILLKYCVFHGLEYEAHVFGIRSAGEVTEYLSAQNWNELFVHFKNEFSSGDRVMSGAVIFWEVVDKI